MRHKHRQGNRSNKKRRQGLVLERLEDRLVFDAAPAPVDAPDASAAVETAQVATTLENAPSNEAQAEQWFAGSLAAPQANSMVDESPSVEVLANESLRRELLVVDGSLPDAQALADSLAANAPESVELRVRLLDPSRDGITQISELLAEWSAELSQDGEAIDAVHLVSHAGPGQLRLGATNYTADSFSAGGAAYDAVSGWNAYLTDSADILLYGCDVAATAGGMTFINNLASATGTDVAASTDATGAAALGGNWVLEVSSGAIETLALSSTANILLPDAVPVVSVSAPGTVYLGQSLTISLAFDNTSLDQEGYGPFIDVFIDTTGPDGPFSSPNDGFSLPTPPTFLGVPVNYTLFTLDDSANGGLGIEHPYAVDVFGNPVYIRTTDAFLGGRYQNGDLLMVIELPFGSFTPTQLPAVVTFGLELSNLADLGTPLEISSRGGFRYGNDPLDNPSPLDPSILGTLATSQVQPQLLDLTKIYNGPEDETATGPNYLRTYRLSLNVADGQTLNNVRLFDTLPDTMQFVAVVGSSGAFTVNSLPPTMLPGGLVDITFNNPVVGTGAAEDAFIEFSYYVPRLDGKMMPLPVLNPNGENQRILDNQAHVTADWVPLDGRDAPRLVSDETTPINSTNPDLDPEHRLEADSIAIQKGHTVFTETGFMGPTPGDVLQYSLDFQISDYYAMGGIVITDQVSDGQVVDLTSFRLQINGNTYDLSAAAIDPSNWDSTINADGTTTLVFRVSDELIRRVTNNEHVFAVGSLLVDRTADASFALEGKLLGGGVRPSDPDPTIANNLADDYAGTSNYNAGQTRGLITYRTTLLDQFRVDHTLNNHSGEAAVNPRDVLFNNVVIAADTLNLATVDNSLPNTGTRVTENSADSVTIAFGSLEKTVHAINGVVNPPQPYNIQPGDTVTYRVRYLMPTGDVENLILRDFLPLPIFDADDPNLDGFINNLVFQNDFGSHNDIPPEAGFFKYGSTETLSDAIISGNPTDPADPNFRPISGFDTSNGNNTVTFTYGTYSNDDNMPLVVDIMFTVRVSDQPFADSLFLTNQVQSAENSTQAPLVEINDNKIVQVILDEPSILNLYKGVVGFENKGFRFNNLTFSDPNGVSTINSTNIFPVTHDELVEVGASDLLDFNVDAGNEVRFAIGIENIGRSDAYDVIIQDLIPDGYISPGSANTFAADVNLTVMRGDGTTLSNGQLIHSTVRVATTNNLLGFSAGTISAAPHTLDGLLLQQGDRVLVKDQTNAEENGIYVVAAPPSTVSGMTTASAAAGTNVLNVSGFGTISVGSQLLVDGVAYTVQSTNNPVTPTSIVLTTNLLSNISNGDTVLVKSTTLVRATDFNENVEFVAGQRVGVMGGNVNGNNSFQLNANVATVDTDAVTYSNVTASAEYFYTYDPLTKAFSVILADTYNKFPDSKIGGVNRGLDPNGNPVGDGSNILLVTYDLKISTDAEADASLINTARLTNYAGTDGGPDHTNTDREDTAEVLIAPAIINKSIISTDLAPSDIVVHVATTDDLGAVFNAAGGSQGKGQFTAAPTMIDGVTLEEGDLVLVKNQTNPVQNGVYLYRTTQSTTTDMLYATGTTTIGVASLPTAPSVGATVTVDGLSYMVVSATTTSITLDSGLVANVANGAPVTVGGVSHLERVAFFDDDIEATLGYTVQVALGDRNAQRIYTQRTATPTVNTDPLVWELALPSAAQPTNIVARVATTAELVGTYNAVTGVLTGTFITIDGINLADGDVILLKNQSDPRQNGLYVRTNSTTLTRHLSWDQIGEITTGYRVFVTEGFVNQQLTFASILPYSSDGTYTNVAAASVGNVGSSFTVNPTFPGGRLTGGLPTDLDGYTLMAGDRVLLKDQSDPLENGIYVVTSSTAWDRVMDLDATGEAQPGREVLVLNGSQAGNVFAPSLTPEVLNTDSFAWVERTIGWNLVAVPQTVRVATQADIEGFVAGSGPGGRDMISPAVGVVDGVRLQVGDRILVNNQMDASQNGLYEVITLPTFEALVKVLSTQGGVLFDTSAPDDGRWLVTPNSVDGVDLRGGDLVLVNDSVLQQANGIYIVDEHADFQVDVGTTNNVGSTYYTMGLSTGNVASGRLVGVNAVIDGATLATGDQVLVKNQNTASQNGVYEVIGADALARAEARNGNLTGSSFSSAGPAFGTYTNVALTAGNLVIDGVTLSVGDIILVNETNQSRNGLYEVTAIGATATLTRATFFNQSAEVNQGYLVAVTGGTSFGGRTYAQSTANVVLNTSNIVWQQYTGLALARTVDFDQGAELAAGHIVQLQRGTTQASFYFSTGNTGTVTVGSTAINWVRTAGDWVRMDDYDTAGEFTFNLTVFVQQGGQFGRTNQVLLNPTPVTLNVDPIEFDLASRWVRVDDADSAADLFVGRKVTVLEGDESAGETWTISNTVNTLNTDNVNWQLFQASNDAAQAVPGEVVTYTLRVRVPEGTTLDATIEDTLDSNLEFESLVSITGTAGVSFDKEAWESSLSDSGSSFTLGGPSGLAIHNSNSDDGFPEYLLITYRARVINDVVNQAGSRPQNDVDLDYGDNSGNSASSVPVKVIEPTIFLSKQISSDGTNYFDGLRQPLDAGDSVHYRIILGGGELPLGLGGVQASVRVATTVNLNNFNSTGYSGQITGVPPMLDGVTLSIGDRVLVKDQSNLAQNGIYVYTAPGVLNRAADFDQHGEPLVGMIVAVAEGAESGTAIYRLQSTVTTLNTTSADFRLLQSKSVKAATTDGDSLFGNMVDGVTIAAGDRVLLTDANNPSNNGIYVFNGSTYSLAGDFNEVNKLADNVSMRVDAGGTVNGARLFNASHSGSSVFINQATDNYDVTLNDPLPAAFTATSFTVLVNGEAAATHDDFEIVGGVLRTKAGHTVDIPAGSTIIITIHGALNQTLPGGILVPNTATSTWSSLDGPVDGERDGSDGPGGALDDYATQASASLPIAEPLLIKDIVTTSEAHTIQERILTDFNNTSFSSSTGSWTGNLTNNPNFLAIRGTEAGSGTLDFSGSPIDLTGFTDIGLRARALPGFQGDNFVVTLTDTDGTSFSYTATINGPNSDLNQLIPGELTFTHLVANLIANPTISSPGGTPGLNMAAIASITIAGDGGSGSFDMDVESVSALKTTATIGEIVRYRLTMRIPEGTMTDVVLRDNLPNNMQFLNDGTAKVTFVSDSNNITSATVGSITGIAAGANVMGNESTLRTINMLPSGPSGVVLGDVNISSSSTISNLDSYASGTPVYFRLGTLENPDRDANAEYIIVEFNALVTNVTTAQAGNQQDNDFSAFVNGTSGTPIQVGSYNGAGVDTGSNVRRDSHNNAFNQVVIVEPQINNLAKTYAGPPPVDDGDQFTYQISFSNTVSPTTEYAPSVRVASSTLPTGTFTSGTYTNVPLSMSGALTIDGVDLNIGDRVLFNQGNSARNGVYQVTMIDARNGVATLSRATDFNDPAELSLGARVSATSGTSAGRIFVQESTGAITVNTTGLTFSAIDIVAPLTGFNPSARTATTGNINLGNPGTSMIGGVTLVTGDRVLVRSQNTASQNGVYIFNGSGSAMTRSEDFDVTAEFAAGTQIRVAEGVFAGRVFAIADSVGALGTNAVNYRVVDEITAFDVVMNDTLDPDTIFRGITINTPYGAPIMTTMNGTFNLPYTIGSGDQQITGTAVVTLEVPPVGTTGHIRVIISELHPEAELAYRGATQTGVTVLVDAEVRNTIAASSLISNTAQVVFSTLPGVGTPVSTAMMPTFNVTGSITPGAAGTATGERNGSFYDSNPLDLTLGTQVNNTPYNFGNGNLNNYAGSNTLTTLIQPPRINKAFKDGSLSDDDSSVASSMNADLVIGEDVTFDILVTLPEGNTNDLRILDVIPPGMSLRSFEVITTSSMVANTPNASMMLAANFNGTVTLTPTTSSSLPGTDGTDITFDFDNVIVTRDNVGNNNSFVLRVVARVDNVIGNQAGTVLTNEARLIYSDPDGIANNGTPGDVTVFDGVTSPGDSSTGDGNTPFDPSVYIREPVLTITKVLPNPQDAQADAGDTVTYRITIANPAGPNAQVAYEVILRDVLDSFLDSPAFTMGGVTATGFGIPFTAPVEADFEFFDNGTNFVLRLDATGPLTGNLDMPPGSQIVLEFTAVLTDDVTTGQVVPNKSEVFWSTTPEGLTGTDTANGFSERTGSNDPNPDSPVVDDTLLNNQAISSEVTLTAFAPLVISQQIISTSHTGVGATADTNATIGEFVVYQVTVSLPEGQTNNLTIDMDLPTGYAFDVDFPVTVSTNVPDPGTIADPHPNTTGGGTFNGTGLMNPTVTRAAGAGVFGNGDNVRFKFDPINLTGDNNLNNNTFTFTYRVLVLDTVNNDGLLPVQTQLTPTGTFVVGNVVAASTGNLAGTYNPTGGTGGTGGFTGAPTTVDGVTLANDNLVLVKNQTNAVQNGIYRVVNAATGAWERWVNFDQNLEIRPGFRVEITGGTTNIGTSWLQSNAMVVLNTTAMAAPTFTSTSSNAVLVDATTADNNEDVDPNNNVFGVTATVVEPELNIVKELSINGSSFAHTATGDAGDIVTYRVTVSHTASSTASAYDLRIDDVLPSALTGLSLTSAVVSNGGTDTDVSGSFMFSGNTLSTVESGANDSVDLLLATGGNPNNEVLVLIFTGTLSTTLQPNQMINNDTITLNYNSLPHDVTAQQTNFITGANGIASTDQERQRNDTDSVDITVPTTLTLVKSIVGTSQSFTSGTNVAIGETVTYQLNTTVQDGVNAVLTLTDDLPPGIQYIANTARFHSADGVMATGAVSGTVYMDGDSIDAQDITDGGAGGNLVFSFVQVNAPGENGLDTDSFQVRYEAVVLNVLSNQTGVNLTNSATVATTGPTATAGPSTQTVTVVEPRITVAKTITSSTTGLDAGDTITYQIVIDNLAANGATTDAFDVNLTDLLPPGVTIASINAPVLAGGAGVDTALAGVNTGTLTGVFDIPLDGSVTITFTTNGLPNSTTPNLTLTSDLNVFFSSLNGANANERTGADITDPEDNTPPAPVGSTTAPLNNYAVGADVSATTVNPFSVTKTLLSTDQAHTTNPSVTIGEVVTYQVVVTLMEGTTHNIALTDTLPAGMQFVANSAMITSNSSSMVITGFNANSASQTLSMVVNPGDVNNAAASDTDTFTYTYQALVLDVLGNSGVNGSQTSLTNDLDASGDDVPPDVDNQVTTPVVEPLLQIVKSHDDVDRSVTLGQTITYTLVISHTADSTATAFDLAITDAIPTGLIITGTPMVSSTGSPVGIGMVNVSGGGTGLNLSVDELPVGSTVTITYTALVELTAPQGGTPLVNNTRLYWDSLPNDDINPINPNDPNMTADGGDRDYGPMMMVEATNPNADTDPAQDTESVTVGPYSISNYVWHDLNADGVQDPLEKGIGNVRVWVDLNNDGTFDMTEPSAITDANGEYLISGLAVGTYVVRVDASTLPPNVTGTFTFDDPDVGGTPSANGNQTTVLIQTGDPLVEDRVDFGYVGNLSVGDLVWLNFNGNTVQDGLEPGIGNVIVNLFRDLNGDGDYDDFGEGQIATTTTGNLLATLGTYQFTGLFEGNYIIEVDTFSPALANATPNYDLDNGTTNPNARSGSFLLDANRDDVDFGFIGAANLGDRVWFDLNGDGMQTTNEPGLPGITVNLYKDFNNDGLLDAGDLLIGSMTTGADGIYGFDDLIGDNYLVEVVTAGSPLDGVTNTFDKDDNGGSAANDSVGSVMLGSTETDLGVDFGYRGPFTIDGTVYHDRDKDNAFNNNDTGIGNVTVELYWDTNGDGMQDAGDILLTMMTTPNNGFYQFSNLIPGNYLIVELQPAGYGNSETPTNLISASILESSITDQNFGDTTGSIAGVVYRDDNNNGVQDMGEPGIENVDVTLEWSGPDGMFGVGDDDRVLTIQTDANGAYLFDTFNTYLDGNDWVTGRGDSTSGLLSTGLYRIIETQPANFFDGAETAGNAAVNAGGVQGANSGRYGNDQIGVSGDYIQLSPGQDATGYLFGELTPDLAVTKDDGETLVVPGQTITYTILVENLGNQFMSNVTVVDTLPNTIIEFVSATAPNPITFTEVNGVVTFMVGDLAGGDSLTLTVTARVRDVIPTLVEEFTNTVAITGSDGVRTFGPNDFDDLVPENNVDTDTDQVPATPDLVIMKDDNRYQLAPGDKTTYTLTVQNVGNQEATGVVVVDTLPPQLIFVSASAGGVYDEMAGTVTWNVASLPTNDEVQFTVTVQVPFDLRIPNTFFTNVATVVDDGENGPDPTPENNRDEDVDELFFFGFDSFNNLSLNQPSRPFFREVEFERPNLPIDPLFTGITDPGTTLYGVIYDEHGLILGTQTVVADAGGNWCMTFPNSIIGKQPHRMEVHQTMSGYNHTEHSGYNLRRFFHPTVHSTLFFSKDSSPETVMRSRPSVVLESMSQTSLRPLTGDWSLHHYEYRMSSVNPADR